MINKNKIFLFFTIFYVFPIMSFGPPDWAKPYLGNSCPKDCEIVSKDDKFLTIYTETEFSISENGHIVKTKRALIENISESEEIFWGIVPFDDETDILQDLEFNVEAKYGWKKIKVEKKSLVAKSNQKRNLAFISGGPIPSHHKFSWQYSIVNKSTLLLWEYDFIFENLPILQKKVFLTPYAKNRNFCLNYVDNISQTLADGFSKISEDCYLINNIPALSQLDINLEDNPCFDCLYPYFIFENKDKEKTKREFSAKYLEKIQNILIKEDEKVLKEMVNELTKDKNKIEEKIKAITDFVQFSISYDDSYVKGEHGLIPLSPTEVLRSRRGDCKGKSLLAQTLLNYIGVKSDLIHLRYLNEYYPSKKDSISQAIFNHVILAIENVNSSDYDALIIDGPAKGKILFDPTSYVTSFGASPPGVEGMLAFLINSFEENFFEIHLKNPAVVNFYSKVQITFDQYRNLKANVNIVDNGRSILCDFVEKKLPIEKEKEKLLEIYTKVFPNVKITDFEIKNPPKTNCLDALIDLKIVKPYLELRNSTLFTNLLQIPLLSLSPSEEQEKKKGETKNKITLKSPWNRNLNRNGMEKKIVVEMQITFESTPLFPLPQNFSLKKPWIEFSLEWYKNGEKEYICKMELFEPRGIWEQEKFDERSKDLNKIANAIKQPIKG